MVLLPRVKISTQENVTLTQPGGPAVIALMGTAQWGEVGKVHTFNSYANLLEYYKSDASSLTLVRGADVAYNNGAYTIKAIRVAASAKAKASKAFNGNTGGEVGVLTFTGLFEGSYGNNILITVLAQGTGRIVSVTDGISTERYTNNNNANGYATNQAIASAINGNSALVSVAVKVGSETTNLVDAISATALLLGNDGSTTSFTDYTTAFDSTLVLEDWDLLLIPGESSDANHATMVGKVEARVSSEKKYGVFVSGVANNEAIATQKARTTLSERFVLCSPSIKYLPTFQATQLTLDGSYLACAIAGQIAQRDVEISITRKPVSVSGLSVDSATAKEFYNAGELEELLGAGIVPVSLIGGGLKIARGVTRASNQSSVFFELNVQRIVDYVKAQTQTKLDGFLGDPNLQRIRDVMAREVDGVLQQDILDEVIANYEPTEVTEGASPDTVNVSMTIQPTFAINFINVTLAISRL
jgi:hypothetical protein